MFDGTAGHENDGELRHVARVLTSHWNAGEAHGRPPHRVVDGNSAKRTTTRTLLNFHLGLTGIGGIPVETLATVQVAIYCVRGEPHGHADHASLGRETGHAVLPDARRGMASAHGSLCENRDRDRRVHRNGRGRETKVPRR
jgi:hypothetical protein